MQTYTVGEIFRLGLLKNHKGEPLKHKSSVANLVRTLTCETGKTPWGIGKLVSQADIDNLNNRFL